MFPFPRVKEFVGKGLRVSVKRDLISVKRDLISVKRDLISVKRDQISVKSDQCALPRPSPGEKGFVGKGSRVLISRATSSKAPGALSKESPLVSKKT
jgi:hypothetical protein